jgi:RNA polymerase sigma-70 factor, ECF subfamily
MPAAGHYNARRSRMSEPDGPPAANVTALLQAWSEGDDDALRQLMPLVERELRQVAARYMRGERPGHTLQPTALVNEAYLRLVGAQHVRWQNRAHFLAVSARTMRRILVDMARARGYQKRGGRMPVVPLDDVDVAAPEPGHDFVALHEALEALAGEDARKSQVVELRFFGGLTVNETAEVLGLSPETVMRDWAFAKAWLLRALTGGAPAAGA